MGYLTDKRVVKFIPPFTTTFQIIEKDWNLLRKALFDKEIQNPHIFLNIIIPKLLELISQFENIGTIEKRNEFEEKVNNLVNLTIQDKTQFKKI